MQKHLRWPTIPCYSFKNILLFVSKKRDTRKRPTNCLYLHNQSDLQAKPNFKIALLLKLSVQNSVHYPNDERRKLSFNYAANLQSVIIPY